VQKYKSYIDLQTIDVNNCKIYLDLIRSFKIGPPDRHGKELNFISSSINDPLAEWLIQGFFSLSDPATKGAI